MHKCDQINLMVQWIPTTSGAFAIGQPTMVTSRDLVTPFQPTNIYHLECIRAFPPLSTYLDCCKRTSISIAYLGIQHELVVPEETVHEGQFVLNTAAHCSFQVLVRRPTTTCNMKSTT